MEKEKNIVYNTLKEFINKDSFLKLFELSLKQFKNYKKEYYIKIIKKIQYGKNISIEEYNNLEKLLFDKDFFLMIEKNLYQTINDGKNIQNDEKNDIIPELFKNFLLKNILINTIKSNTHNILEEKKEQVGLVYSNEFIDIFLKNNVYIIKKLSTNQITEFSYINLTYLEQTGLIKAEIDGKLDVLINKKGEQVSEKGINYKGFNLRYFEKYGIVIANMQGQGSVLLDKNLIQITKKDVFYKWFYFTQFGIIMARIEGEGDVLLNKSGKQISEKGIFYDSFDLSYMLTCGIIIANIKGKGKVLLNKSGKQISKKGVFYKSLNLEYLIKTGFIIAKEKEHSNFVLDINGNIKCKKERTIHFDENEKKFFTKSRILKIKDFINL